VIRYSDHAVAQMTERAISRDDVEYVLDNHDTTYPAKTAGRMCYVGPVGTQRLKVVARPAEWGFMVVTAFFT
jgi:Domain of unknown function (DUF4258)